MPRDKDARMFYRVAKQRLPEAEDLLTLKERYSTVAVYLGGYVVETMLKALIIETSAPTRRRNTVREFRGARGHDLEYLRGCYYNNGGAPMPMDVARSFAQIHTWSTKLRYQAGTIPLKKAHEFLAAVRHIVQCAEGRL
jgi:hypothetical protein